MGIVAYRFKNKLIVVIIKIQIGTRISSIFFII